jgi:hypothetical protein
MTITIPPELEVTVRNKAQSEGLSIEAYVERLIREDEQFIEQSEEPLDDTDPEFAEIREAVLEGLARASGTW